MMGLRNMLGVRFLSNARTFAALGGGACIAAGAAAAYCTVEAEEAGETIYVINGFYMSMRDKFCKPGNNIHYYSVEWDSKDLSWADFRGKVLGGTDPATAEAGSLRREILDGWEKLGLKAQPNVGDNGMHASASPFEGLCERINWLGAKLEEDEFGKALLEAGIPKETIEAWTLDPQVEFEGKMGSLWDNLEDMDTIPCLGKAMVIAGAKGAKPSLTKMQAYVFIKPHAVTPAVEKLVAATFAAKGIKVVSDGVIKAEDIDKNKYIDNHYYAIANKATLTTPDKLNPPAKKLAEFEEKFGLPWKKALADGVVYNAMDGCKKLGIDGAAMDKIWAESKKAGNLIKFGGGFYCGKVVGPPPCKPWWKFW